MTIRSYLYVSESTLIIPDEEWRVLEIVAVARRRNPTLDVTGALMFTETHFAQVLEGPAAAIDELMASIRRDDRHMNIRMITDEMISERRFGNWSMAYSGPMLFVEEHIQPLLRQQTDDSRHEAADGFISLMQELVA